MARIEFRESEDFSLERCELQVVEKTLREVRKLGRELHSNQVDTLLLRLFDAVELRCIEMLRRKKGTIGHDGSEP
jgi:hypothetical protein